MILGVGKRGGENDADMKKKRLPKPMMKKTLAVERKEERKRERENRNERGKALYKTKGRKLGRVREERKNKKRGGRKSEECLMERCVLQKTQAKERE